MPRTNLRHKLDSNLVLITRARESRAMAEVEVLSSTSDEVCEVWSGSQIVRATGKATMKEIIYRQTMTSTSTCALLYPSELMDLAEAVRDKHYKCEPPVEPSPTTDSELDAWQDEFLKGAPNLTLNTGGAVTPYIVRVLSAILGLVLQTAVIVAWGLTTYYWKYTRAGKFPPAYGFPCAVCGAIMTSLGLLLCGYVVENVTKERTYIPTSEIRAKGKESDYNVLRIQQHCVVGAQIFGSMMIENHKGNSSLRMSRRLNVDKRQGRYKFCTACGAALSVLGFFGQFIGLRTLHSSATLSQLGLMLVMTGVRSLLRGGLVRKPDSEPLAEDHELSDVALKLNKCSELKILEEAVSNMSSTDESDIRSPEHGPITGNSAARTFPPNTQLVEEQGNIRCLAYRVVRMRAALEQTTGWSEESSMWGRIVANAIEEVFRHVRDLINKKIAMAKSEISREWDLDVYLQARDGRRDYVKMAINPEQLVPNSNDNERTARTARIYSAILGLWHFALVRNLDKTRPENLLNFARVVGWQERNKHSASSISEWLRKATYGIEAYSLRDSLECQLLEKKKEFNSIIRFGSPVVGFARQFIR